VNINLKNLFGVAMLASTLSCLTVPAAAAAADPALKAALEARYTAMKLAMDAHDAATLKAMLAPGFASVDVMGGSQDAAQMIAAVAKIPPDPHRTSVATVLSCDGSAKGLIVKQRFDMKKTQSGPDGVQHPVELVSLSTDTWVKPGAVWLLEKTVTDDMTLYRDGKLAAHRARTK
jgi:hypothetical protein